MDWLKGSEPTLRQWLPLLAALVALVLALGATRLLTRLRERRAGKSLPVTRQLAMLVVTSIGVVLVVLASPIVDTLKGQLLGLLGLVFTGVVAFASTTFVANAMAGFMLRSVGNFRVGDWLRVGDQFGRVTERGLFHTEIQTEDRDLATLPNLYLVTNPVKVVRASGTIVATTLSLGYDLSHAKIEALLIAAAKESGLEEPFVHVIELGDFSVTYRVAGFLPDVKHLLSVRSRLHAGILDSLHGAGVEIVSPNFMNQRQLAEGLRFVPAEHAPPPSAQAGAAPEEIIFDKAEEQASLEELRAERERLRAEIEGRSQEAADASEEERKPTESEIVRKRLRIDEISARLEQEEAKEREPGKG